jgi:EAL domain-containing protein (putative c-di-GMP-specific phosphodiesterase class I)
MDELRALGVRLAMDDFGTGYASLGYLMKYRFDKIKIDRSFVRNLGVDADAAAIVRAVVGMCEELGMSTNAEGVENEDQLRILRDHGCREVQGFLYWPPLTPQAICGLVEGRVDVALATA